jgi:hypothetical protein
MSSRMGSWFSLTLIIHKIWQIADKYYVLRRDKKP